MSEKVKARAVQWEIGITSTGHEQVGVMFEVVDGERSGQRFAWYGHFTEKATDRTLDSLRHCGWVGNDITDLQGLDANEVQIVLEEDTYEGKTRMKVAWVNRAGAAIMKTQLDPNAARAFAARLKGIATAHRQQYGAQPAPTPRAAPAASSKPQSASGGDWGDPDPSDPGPQDDIPF